MDKRGEILDRLRWFWVINRVDGEAEDGSEEGDDPGMESRGDDLSLVASPDVRDKNVSISRGSASDDLRSAC